MTRSLVPSRLPRLLRCPPNYGRVRKAGFQSSAHQLSAHEFSMPAMSPTMTEGNITSWKVQAGDTFAAGDVLLEIETDKAQMDVEAQDDGIMAKIVQPAGSKGVKVGTRIAVTADPEDDVATLDLSALPSSQPSSSSSEQGGSAKQPEERADKSSESVTSSKETSGAEKTKSPEHTPSHPPHNQKYPLFPSVIQLLHERGISEEERGKISASGPNGRLLKGDVLAYLGEIESSYPATQSKRIKDLGHLDLSNIEVVAPPKETDTQPQREAAVKDSAPAVSEIALPISLAAVHAVRERIQKVLGVDMSVETFVARATQLCNDNLPRSKKQPPSADELFNAVLGLDKVNTVPSESVLVPQIQAFGSALTSKHSTSQITDVYDELTGGSKRIPKQTPPRTRAEIDPNIGLFSVSVPAGDEKRARVFLERLKTVLQAEPGKLVL